MTILSSSEWTRTKFTGTMPARHDYYSRGVCKKQSDIRRVVDTFVQWNDSKCSWRLWNLKPSSPTTTEYFLLEDFHSYVEARRDWCSIVTKKNNGLAWVWSTSYIWQVYLRWYHWAICQEIWNLSSILWQLWILRDWDFVLSLFWYSTGISF